MNNNNLKRSKCEVPIGCLDGRTSRYERRQIKAAMAKLFSKQNLNKTLIDAVYLLSKSWRRWNLVRLLGSHEMQARLLGTERTARPGPCPSIDVHACIGILT